MPAHVAGELSRQPVVVRCDDGGVDSPVADRRRDLTLKIAEFDKDDFIIGQFTIDDPAAIITGDHLPSYPTFHIFQLIQAFLIAAHSEVDNMIMILLIELSAFSEPHVIADGLMIVSSRHQYQFRRDAEFLKQLFADFMIDVIVDFQPVRAE